MSTLTISQWQDSFEKELLKREVKVFYDPRLKKSLGRYCGNIYISKDLESNAEETLIVTVHETVHFLQQERGLLIGVSRAYNPLLTEKQESAIDKIVKEYYSKEEWDLEIPAWSLQYNKELVFQYLRNS